MPIYLFENAKGEQIEREFSVADCPRKIGAYRKIIAPIACLGVLTDPDKENRIAARQYRTNREVAKGLVNGTMRETDDRPVAGDKQSASSVSQLNGMIDHARKGFDI